MKFYLQYSVVLLVTLHFIVIPQNVVAQDQKSILVTGASTGIGRHLAESLATAGYHVYAGARKDKDLAELGAIENITAVRLDVTKQDQVDAAFAKITEKGTGLYGLVNNAGVGGGGEVVETPIEAFTDSFSEEMKPQGVSVSVVEPGNYKSHIRRSSVSRRLEKVKATGSEMTDEMKEASEATTKRELSYKEPDEVTEAFMHALFDDNPLRRYMVVPNEKEQDMTIRTKVNELVQLNRWGPYSYSRDELIKMLDEALSSGSSSK